MDDHDERLDRIFDDLSELQDMDDTEIAHIKADELLTEACRVFAAEAGAPYMLMAEQIISAYEAVGKWYA